MIIYILFFYLIILILVGGFKNAFSLPRKKVIDVKHVNQNSYQKYAKFYGEYVPNDQNFDWKLKQIFNLITHNKITDIKKIAEMSQCGVPECILKIRYLKNKRYIGDYYIDTVNLQLLPCSEEDQLLLEKYKPFVYGSHLQINEIANVINNPNYLTIQELRKKVYQDIKYLYDKGLINGIKLDTIDRQILYYSVEKRKVDTDIESVHCPNCGALNDVDIRGKVRCGYCQTIIRGRESMEEGI
ncbi:MAG: hypothetical protein IJJ63_01600 [Bacilli bacterium]|nr:hypothetical protein [Bacilli bacterium]